MKAELKQIINELREVLDDSRIYVTNETFLDAVLRIYNTEQINKQKKFYPKSEFKNDFKKETSTLTSKEESPTENQIKAMKRLNLTIPASSTKKEVWRIMKEHNDKNNN
jgi:hypothetical protein